MLLPDDRCPPEHRRGRERFCPLSLEDWIGAANRAGVAAVPIRRLATFERDDVLKHEYHGPHQARLEAAFATARRRRTAGRMARWDCCANAGLKERMARGHSIEMPGDAAELRIDARLHECAFEYPQVELPVWERPWVDDVVGWNGYPVEYRAFIEDGELQGISSYYPQRALRRDDDEIAEVTRLARAVTAALETPFDWPRAATERPAAEGMVRLFEDKKASLPNDRRDATIDFMVTRHGIVLLEGGPPVRFGAHPCCFEGRRTIEGVALKAEPEQSRC